MRKQPYPLMDLTKGLNVSKSAVFLMDGESPNLENVTIHENIVKKDLYMTAFGNDLPLDGVPMYIDSFFKLDGAEYLLVVTTKWIYEVDTSGNYTKRNPSDFDSTEIEVTFDEATQTITRTAGDFETDGFEIGQTITTTSTTNPGPFIISDIDEDVITVEEGIVDEAADDHTVYCLYELKGTEDDAFDSEQTFLDDGTEVFFLTNGIDYVMYWDGSGLFTFTTFYAKRLCVFKSRLFLGGCEDTGEQLPQTVYWSAMSDPVDFTSTGSGYIDLADTADWVVAFALFKDRLYVIKERSIWELVYVGGTVYFDPQLRIDGIGSYAPNTVISLGESIVFFGNDNVYTYDGLQLETLADNLFTLFYDTVKKIVNTTYMHRAVAIYVEELSEYWMGLPTTGERSSILFKYNFYYKSWTKKNIEVTALGYYSVTPKTLWVDLVGDWSEQTWIAGSKALPSGAPTTLIGTADGNMWEDDRLTTDTAYMCYETKDFVFTHAERWVEVMANIRGGVFTMSYSVDEGVTWSTPRAYTADEDEFQIFSLPINTTSLMMRMRIESFAEKLEIRWIEPWYIPRCRVLNALRA